MNLRTTFIFLLLICQSCLGQIHLQSGNYGELKIAYDSLSKIVTGKFESYTGFDEVTKEPKFSCIFYFSGTATKDSFQIISYYPFDVDSIAGYLKIDTETKLTLQLKVDHGGCWNVFHFSDQPVSFVLKDKKDWTQIRFITAPKSFFHSKNLKSTRKKSFLLKSDFVFINQIVGAWALCTYYGKKTSVGWIKLSDLN